MVHKLNEQTLTLPQPFADEVAKAQAAWRSNDNTRRLWSKDVSLWTGRDEADWLGWLTVVNQALHDTGSLQEFGRELSAENFSDVLLLGMGGSSLGPEALAKNLGSAPRYPRLNVLDTTDPQQVRRLERGIDLGRTLIVVSSKSGTTLEPNVLMDYFLRARQPPSAVPWRSTSSPSPTLARSCKEPQRQGASAVSSTAFQISAAAIRCFRISAWFRWRQPATMCANSSKPLAPWRKRADPTSPRKKIQG